MARTVDEKIDRLAGVFDAIANAWTGSPAQGNSAGTGDSATEATLRTDPCETVRAGVQIFSTSSFAHKMTNFVQTLTNEERREWDVLMNGAIFAARAAAERPVTARHTIPNETLRQLDIKLSAGVVGEPLLATPTITITTITTTIASHPVITCNAAARSQ